MVSHSLQIAWGASETLRQESQFSLRPEMVRPRNRLILPVLSPLLSNLTKRGVQSKARVS